jgi:hypothetical protein
MNKLSSSLKSSLESLKNSDLINMTKARLEHLLPVPGPSVSPQEVPNPAWSYLKGDFFHAPKGWNPNSPDLYPYYRIVFYGLLVVFLLFVIVVSSLFQGAGPKEAKLFSQTIETLTNQPEKFQEQATAFLKKYPQGVYKAQMVQLQADIANRQFLQALNLAQRQPNLPLKLQAYQALLKQQTPPSPEMQKELQETMGKYAKMIEGYENQLAKARTYSQKQYFTSSLLLLSKLVKGGPQYGHLYTEAQDLLNRTSAKKIDYFLVKGQLRKARIALRDAQIHGVSSDVIDSLAKKIKSLEQLKPLGR